MNYLPGPVLNDQYRAAAIRQIVNRLLELAEGMPLDAPLTWLTIAVKKKIKIHVYYLPEMPNSRGCLRHGYRDDSFIIEFNGALDPQTVVETLVHELAHWLERTMTGQWLCNEDTVHWYGGPVEDEQHDIARQVERVLLAPVFGYTL